MTTRENQMNTQREERGPLWHATNIVFNYIDNLREKTGEPWVDYEVDVVSFTTIHQDWRVILKPTLPEGFFFDVIYERSSEHVLVRTHIQINEMIFHMDDLEENVFVPLAFVNTKEL